jgi:hypothetical protein
VIRFYIDSEGKAARTDVCVGWESAGKGRETKEGNELNII